MPDDLEKYLRWGQLALQIGTDVGQLVLSAMRDGNVEVLDQLRAVLPSAELMRARDESLKRSQDALAARALGERESQR